MRTRAAAFQAFRAGFLSRADSAATAFVPLASVLLLKRLIPMCLWKISTKKSVCAMASLLLVTLGLTVAGCTAHRVSNPNRHASRDAPGPQLVELLQQGNRARLAGEYHEAAEIYESGYEKAKRSKNPSLAVQFLNNLGGLDYQLFRYRDAIQTFLEARGLAASQGNKEVLGALDFNLSALYFDLGDIEDALELADQGLKLPDDATARYRAGLLIQCARIKGRQKNWGEAIALLQDAIEASRAQLDVASEAYAWSHLGDNLLERGQLSAAEHALLEAYRLRKLTHDYRLCYSYEALGHLRMLEGDPQAASAFFDRAVEATPVVSSPALWGIYYERGNAKLAQARLEEAFADFGNALRSARRWHAQVLPADAFRISTEVELHEVYSSYVELAARLYAQTGRSQFAEQGFAAAEENRAASLRALWAGPDLTQRLPGEYWETLAHLFQAEAAVVKAGPDADVSAVRRLRLRATEMEARAGLDFPTDSGKPDDRRPNLLQQTRKKLAPTEVFLGFHLGTTESLLWIVTNRGFELRHLPPREELAGTVALFVKAVRGNSAEAVTLGNRLYSELFGGASRQLLEKPQWILALDGPLFEVPFAALVQASNSRSNTPTYVVEHHAIQIVPGVWALFSRTRSNWNGPVVGVGDPIYNRADPRLPHALSGGRANSVETRPRTVVRSMELARLVGSGREIETYGSIWRSYGYQPLLLTGGAANRQMLMAALRRNPSVVHVAAHVLFSPQHSSPGLIALALQPSDEVELLSATEISALRLDFGLVVLNGCSSARGEALPGAGLMGMTRAWLAAGARAVIATRWATSDQQEGELLRSFYNRLASLTRSRPKPSYAQILQQAQLAELHAGGFRANPAYWAAYLCVERD